MPYPTARTSNTIDRNCANCGKPFIVFKSQIQYGYECCSRQCTEDLKRRPLEDRFWDYVWKTDNCWIWTGAYRGLRGTIWDGSKTIYAHRASWIIHVGPIPNSLNILHHCDNMCCVNPSELFLGTSADNSADMVAKGRQCRGEKHHKAKLTEEQVLEIRNSGLTQRQIVEKYGIVQSVASAILLRQIWKHI